MRGDARVEAGGEGGGEVAFQLAVDALFFSRNIPSCGRARYR